MTAPVVKYKTASPAVKAAERKRTRKEAIASDEERKEPKSTMPGDGKVKPKSAGSEPVSTRPRGKAVAVQDKRVKTKDHRDAKNSGTKTAKEEVDEEEDQDDEIDGSEDLDDEDEEDEQNVDEADQDDDDGDESTIRSSRELAKGLGKSHVYEASLSWFAEHCTRC